MTTPLQFKVTDPPEDVCPICIGNDDLTWIGHELQTRTEIISHVFHQSCLEAYIDAGNTKCPKCVIKDIDVATVHNLGPRENKSSWVETALIAGLIGSSLLLSAKVSAWNPNEIASGLNGLMLDTYWCLSMQPVLYGCDFSRSYLKEQLFSDQLDQKTVECAIKAKIDVNESRAPLYFTPLHSILSSNSVPDHKILQTLLDAGANINARSSLGETPLHTFVKKFQYNSDIPSESFKETFQFLIDSGADGNALDQNGMTPLTIFDNSIHTLEMALLTQFNRIYFKVYNVAINLIKFSTRVEIEIGIHFFPNNYETRRVILGNWDDETDVHPLALPNKAKTGNEYSLNALNYISYLKESLDRFSNLIKSYFIQP